MYNIIQTYFGFGYRILTRQIIHCFPRFPSVNVVAVEERFIPRVELFVCLFFVFWHKSKGLFAINDHQNIGVKNLNGLSDIIISIYYLTAVIGFIADCRPTPTTPREKARTTEGNILIGFNVSGMDEYFWVEQNVPFWENAAVHRQLFDRDDKWENHKHRPM